MILRTSVVSGQFYPYDEKSCRKQIEVLLSNISDFQNYGNVVAGIVPHAGWVFSGQTAAKVFAQIDKNHPPDTFILFSAVHRWGIKEPAIYSKGAWECPLGNIPIDEELASQLLKAGNGSLVENNQAHSQEHSIEVQIPFIAYLFPGSKILPITVPPSQNSHIIGKMIGEYVSNRKIKSVIIGTTDLTHYGTGYGFSPKGGGEESIKWVKEVNDASIIKLAIQMKAENIVEEAGKNHSACGGGAMAATVSAAKAMGSTEGLLLEYTTSLDMMPNRRSTDFVGYAGIIFPVKP